MDNFVAFLCRNGNYWNKPLENKGAYIMESIQNFHLNEEN